jgi:hypothetical protein
MALKISPPTHKADALGTFISAHDTAWDSEMWRADMEAIQAAALADAQKVSVAAFKAKHPKASEDEIEAHRAACVLTDVQMAEAHLKPGASEFTIRRLPYPVHQVCDQVEGTKQRLTAFARAGLRGITSEDWLWSADEKDLRAPESVMQALFDANEVLPLEIGMAVIAIGRPLDEAETFR